MHPRTHANTRADCAEALSAAEEARPTLPARESTSSFRIASFAAASSLRSSCTCRVMHRTSRLAPCALDAFLSLPVPVQMWQR
jgi:hypothetical protein